MERERELLLIIVHCWFREKSETGALCLHSTVSMQDHFTPSTCYYGMLVPLLFPVGVAVAYCNRMGLKFFIHN